MPGCGNELQATQRKAQQLERAFAVLAEMQRAGIRPDAVSFTCLIDACGRAQQIEQAPIRR